jgi:hypothetical protein
MKILQSKQFFDLSKHL